MDVDIDVDVDKFLPLLLRSCPLMPLRRWADWAGLSLQWCAENCVVNGTWDVLRGWQPDSAFGGKARWQPASTRQLKNAPDALQSGQPWTSCLTTLHYPTLPHSALFCLLCSTCPLFTLHLFTLAVLCYAGGDHALIIAIRSVNLFIIYALSSQLCTECS